MKRINRTAILLIFVLLVITSGCKTRAAPDPVSSSREEDQTETASELLSQWQSWEDLVQRDEPFVLTIGKGIQNEDLIVCFLEGLKVGKQGSFWGLTYCSTVPMVYTVEYDGEKLLLTVYRPNADGVERNQYEATGIYQTGAIYYLTDEKSIYFSIPRIDLSHIEETGNDMPSTDWPGGIPVAEAKKIVQNVNARFKAFVKECGEKNLGNPWNSSGIVIPEWVPADPPMDGEYDVVLERMVKFGEAPFYRFDFYQNGIFSGDAYYIDADKGETAYAISMADGMPIPVYDKNTVFFDVPENINAVSQ